MASSGLRGPFSLSGPSILSSVTNYGPGAYALGRTEGNTFLISYVGRSDTDVATRLQNWVGTYNEFKFDYFPSAQAAFEKECNLYHDFSPPDNTIHPAKPEGGYRLCLRCGC